MQGVYTIILFYRIILFCHNHRKDRFDEAASCFRLDYLSARLRPNRKKQECDLCLVVFIRDYILFFKPRIDTTEQ